MDANRGTNRTIPDSPLCRPSTNACSWPWRRPDAAPTSVPCKDSWTSIPFCLPWTVWKKAREARSTTLTTSTNSPCSSPSAWCCCCWRDCGPPVSCAGPGCWGEFSSPRPVWGPPNLSRPEPRNWPSGARRPWSNGTLLLQTACLPVPGGGQGPNPANWI